MGKQKKDLPKKPAKKNTKTTISKNKASTKNKGASKTNKPLAPSKSNNKTKVSDKTTNKKINKPKQVNITKVTKNNNLPKKERTLPSNKIRINKVVIVLLTIFLVLICMIGATMAWFTWNTSQENTTTIVTPTDSIDITYVGGSDINQELNPTATKEEGIVKEFGITRSRHTHLYIDVYLKMNNLPDGLKDVSFKWELYQESALINQGDFSTYNQGDDVKLTVPSVSTSLTEVNFTLYIWIDGNMENPLTMSKQNFNFELRVDVIEQPLVENYIQAGLLLDLQGLTPINNNTWPDNQGNYNIELTDVTYNSINQRYRFNLTSSYGTANTPIIPSTGDFSLEVFFISGANTIKDQAIVSQKINGTDIKEGGRFKLNIKNTTGTKYELFTFLNVNTNANNGTNVTYTINNNISPYTAYHVQVVRKGDKIIQYLNNEKVSENTLSTNSIISQADFNIGRWNDIDAQAFEGEIYAIRVYNKALTARELENNYNVDLINYLHREERYYIKDYLLLNELRTTNDGLYLETPDRYVFKGKTVNNYINIGDDTWRIISIEPDDTLKIIRVTNTLSSIAYDASGNRTSQASSYCLNASNKPPQTTDYYGCNAWSSTPLLTTNYSSGNVANDSSLNATLNGSVYQNFPNELTNILVSHSYDIGFVDTGDTYTDVKTKTTTNTWIGKVGLPTAYDVLNSYKVQYDISAFNTDSWLANLSDNEVTI
ncbi:MAG: LamG-like jellyroll fold domain-containing protein [bacterium]|nr:LamG-like jellyroll fold domain-containing protein [bacterium]